MMDIIYIIYFVYGCVIGSFLNVCVLRSIEKQSVVFPPSHCFACEHQLKNIDLIPVLSYLFLRGKCRYCKAPISKQYPMVELCTGILFLFLGYHMVYLNIELIFVLVFFSIMMVIFVIDLKTMTIPDNLVILSLAVALCYRLLSESISKELFIDMGVGAIAASGILILLYLFGLFVLNQEVIGLGDVKLFISIGVLLGIQGVLVALYIAILIGGFFALMIMIKSKGKAKGGQMPLGPFIVIATLIVFCYEEQLIATYNSLFLV